MWNDTCSNYGFFILSKKKKDGFHLNLEGYFTFVDIKKNIPDAQDWKVSSNQKEFITLVKQIKEAEEILKVMAEAEKASQGATVYKGRLVDIASIKQAKVIVDQARKIKK